MAINEGTVLGYTDHLPTKKKQASGFQFVAIECLKLPIALCAEDVRVEKARLVPDRQF